MCIGPTQLWFLSLWGVGGWGICKLGILTGPGMLCFSGLISGLSLIWDTFAPASVYEGFSPFQIPMAFRIGVIHLLLGFSVSCESVSCFSTAIRFVTWLGLRLIACVESGASLPTRGGWEVEPVTSLLEPSFDRLSSEGNNNSCLKQAGRRDAFLLVKYLTQCSPVKSTCLLMVSSVAHHYCSQPATLGSRPGPEKSLSLRPYSPANHGWNVEPR